MSVEAQVGRMLCPTGLWSHGKASRRLCLHEFVIALYTWVPRCVVLDLRKVQIKLSPPLLPDIEISMEQMLG